VGALVCAAVACWTSFGALTFLDETSPARHVGILPSPLWLCVSLAAALCIAVVWRPSARAVAPLWLSAVLLIPWLPIPLPMSAFVWTGHVVAWTWIAIATTATMPWLVAPWRLWRVVARMPSSRAAALAGLVALVLQGAAAWRTAPHHPSGDEPHYLVMAQSLLRDGDLQIENNHQRRDYAAYYTGDLPPDYVRRGQNGAIYSSHAPGLAVLVAPAFWLLGYPGAVMLVVALSALTSALTWRVAWHVTHSAGASWFAWAMMLSAPVLLLTSAIFPDGVAPLLAVVGLLPIVDEGARSPRRLLAIGAAVMMLPWMHTRLAIIAGALALAVVTRLLQEPQRWTRTAAFLIAPVVGAVAWFGFFWLVYGTLDPTAPIGKRLVAPLLSEGLTGLLLDLKFGLLVAAPIAMTAAGGITSLLMAGPRRLGLEVLAIIVPYTLMIAAWDMWWGGFSPPARFLVPIAPVLAVSGAVFAARIRTASARTGVSALIALSLMIAATMVWVERGALIFADRPDVPPLLSWLTPVVDLSQALPDAFVHRPATVWLLAAVWLLAFVAAGALARAVPGFASLPRPVALGLGCQLTLMCALSASWAINGGSVAKPFDAGPAVVNLAATGADGVGVAYAPFTRVPVPQLASMIPLVRFDVSRSAAPILATRPLPPGTYELRGAMPDARRGVITLRTDRRSQPIAAWDLASLAPAWTRRITIPVHVPGLRIELDDAGRSSLSKLTLSLASAVPRNAWPFPSVEAGHSARYGSMVFYYMDGRSWLEGSGVWVEGATGAEFAVAADDAASSLHMRLRNGAVPNRVLVVSGEWHVDVELNPGEERTIEVPASPVLAATPLRVVPAAGFRPSDVERSSTDERFLGVWLEPVS